MHKLAGAAVALSIAVGVTGCAMNSDDEPMSSGSTNSSMGTTRVGGAEMYPNRNVVENAANAPNLTTLVAAVQAAGLAETLSGPGPFTVFAPDNDAFAALPAGAVDNLLLPANRAQLQSVLTYHVVPGRLTAADLMSRIRNATLTTVNGQSLRLSMQGSSIVLMGANNSRATVEQADVMQSNGVAHVIGGVLMPSM